MTDKTSIYLSRAVLALVVLLGTLAAIRLISDWSIWGHENASDWTGALGTVFTLAITIWLATSEARRRRRQDSDAARLVATRILTRVALAASAVREAQTILEHTSEEVDLKSMAFKRAADCLRADVIVDQVDLATMVPLHSHAALVLAKGLGEREGAKDLIRKVLENPSIDSDSLAPFRMKYAADVASLLHISWIHITQALTVMGAAYLDDSEITIPVPEPRIGKSVDRSAP